MHNCVDAVEKFGGKITDVAEMHAVEQRLRQPFGPSKIVREEPAVKANQLGIGKLVAKMANEGWANVAHCTGDENSL